MGFPIQYSKKAQTTAMKLSTRSSRRLLRTIPRADILLFFRPSDC